MEGVTWAREGGEEGREGGGEGSGAGGAGAVSDLVQEELVFPGTGLEELAGGGGQHWVSGMEPAYVWLSDLIKYVYTKTTACQSIPR